MVKHCAIKTHGAVKATLHAFLTSIRDSSQYPASLSDTITLRTRWKAEPSRTVWKWEQKRKAMPSQEIEARLLYGLSYTSSRATD